MFWNSFFAVLMIIGVFLLCLVLRYIVERIRARAWNKEFGSTRRRQIV